MTVYSVKDEGKRTIKICAGTRWLCERLHEFDLVIDDNTTEDELEELIHEAIDGEVGSIYVESEEEFLYDRTWEIVEE